MHIERTVLPKSDGTLDCDECGMHCKILYELTPSYSKGQGNADLATWFVCFNCLRGLPNKIKNHGVKP